MKTLNLLIALVGLVLVAPSHAAEKIYFVHTDHLGTPQALTDDVQNTVWKAGEDPFGDEAPAIELVKNNIRFPGQYFDVETGLHYNWNRYYDPKTDRYITSDPIGLAGGVNTYLYANANPLRYADPNGLNPAAGCAIGSVAGPVGCGIGGLLGAGVLGGMLMSIPGDTPRDTPKDDTEPKQCEDKPDKWLCEGHAQYEIIGQNKHVIRGGWFTAYGKTESIAARNWKKKVQASAPIGHTARHIRPRCKKVK